MEHNNRSSNDKMRRDSAEFELALGFIQALAHEASFTEDGIPTEYAYEAFHHGHLSEKDVERLLSYAAEHPESRQALANARLKGSVVDVEETEVNFTDSATGLEELLALSRSYPVEANSELTENRVSDNKMWVRVDGPIVRWIKRNPARSSLVATTCLAGLSAFVWFATVPRPLGRKPFIDHRTHFQIIASESYLDELRSLAGKWRNLDYVPEILEPDETRHVMQGIRFDYKGRNRVKIPDLWFASSKPMVDTLRQVTDGVVWNRNSEDYHEFPQQPVAVLVKDSYQSQVSRLFVRDNPLSDNSEQLPYTFADPVTTASGNSALRYCLAAFHRQNRVHTFEEFLGRMKRTGYHSSRLGSGQLANNFANSPDAFVLTHRSLAYKIASEPSAHCVVIVPEKTALETPVAVVLHHGDEQGAKGAREFLKYLVSEMRLPDTKAKDVGEPEDINDQIRTWERVFYHSARLLALN